MIRKILLIGIMLVVATIIVVGLQRYLARDHASQQPEINNRAASTPPAERGIKLIKYDKDNNPIAEITGKQATQASEGGPVDIVEPMIRLLKDKNNITVITADTGRIEGREQNQMGEGWLKGNVTLTVVSAETGDNTVVACDEMKYRGSKGQIFIPGAMTMSNRSMNVSGSRLTADRGLGGARLEHNVRVVLKEAAEGVLQKLTGDEKAGTAPGKTPEKPPQHLVITCDGTALFRRDGNRVTFDKNVLTAQGKNAVRGDSMVIEFEQAQEDSGGEEKPSGKSMTIRRVVMGSEKKEGVVVEGPGRRAYGDRLEYDGKTGLLVFTGSPCRMIQKSGKQTYDLKGSEIRFGRRRLLGRGETLPAGMGVDSQKILIAGSPENPASAVSTQAGTGQSSSLRGKRIILDQDMQIAWLEGEEGALARAEQGNDHISGVGITLIQRTKTRSEKVRARGPGLLQIGGRRRKEGGTLAEPTVVNFGDGMTYSPDGHRARFTGGVKLVDGATTSRSRTLTIEFAEGKGQDRREIRKVVATGDVVVTGDEQTAKGEALVYTFPADGSGRVVTALTAKPGESCEMTSAGIVCRSEKMNMIQTPKGEGKTAIRWQGQGRGFLRHTPAAGSRGKGFEVRYSRSGTFDDAEGKAVFEGDVRIRQKDMNVNARHVVMDFAAQKGKAGGQARGTEQLDFAGMTAAGDVTVVSGPPGDRLTVTGKKLVWQRDKGTAEVRGGEGPKEFARILRDALELEAPVMLMFLKDDRLDRLVTTGGGRLKVDARAQGGETGEKPQKFDVTWTKDGLYRTLGVADSKAEPTAMARVAGNVRAAGEDSDVTGDVLTIYMGPEPKTTAAGSAGLEVRRALAVGNARAKMFMPEGNYYRYARGDSLEWDRLHGRMVVMSDKSDAVVWDNSNEWAGKRLVVNRSAEGRLVAESTTSRRITFYDEGTPRVSSESARGWKPIY